MPFDERFFNGMPVGFVRTSLDGTILEITDSLAAVLGLTRGEVEGKSIIDFYWDPNERSGILRRIRAGADSIAPFETRFRDADGNEVWLWAAIKVVRDDQGRPFELHALVGQSERLPQATARIERGLDRHRRLNELFYQAVQTTSAQDFLGLVTDSLRDILEADIVSLWVERDHQSDPLVMELEDGLSLEVPIDLLESSVSVSDCRLLIDGDSPLERFCRSLAAAGVLSILAVRTGGQGSGAETSRVFLFVGSKAVRSWLDEEAGYLQIVGLGVAETLERLELLDRLRTQTEFLEGVLELAPAGILVLDQGLTVIRANGLAKEHLRAMDPAWRDGGPVPHPLGRLLADFRDGALEGPADLDTAGRFYEISAKKLESGRGRDALVAVLLDVTEREERRRLAESQERLAALGRFAAGIAHDFNNLLTGIVGYAQLSLQEKGVVEDVRENLEVIASQGRRAATRVRQITDDSRQSVLLKDVLDLVEVVQGGVDLMSRTLPETMRLETRVEAESCMVEADRTRMDQVLTNLVLNAADAVEGAGTVQVILRVCDCSGADSGDPVSRGRWALLSVEDDGPGIPEHLRRRVLEPFFTTKPQGQGTGLGLSQVYGIVKQHGGFVFFGDSDLGGASVRIYLPLLRAEGVPQSTSDGESSERISTRMKGVPRGEGRRILLVEDESSVRNAMARMAQGLGYEVVTAASAEEAWALLQGAGFAFDLVLSDVVMPGRGGLDLAADLAAAAPSLPCVMVSGYPLHEEGSRHSPNIFGWVSKPVDMGGLGVALAGALRMSDRGRKEGEG